LAATGSLGRMVVVVMVVVVVVVSLPCTNEQWSAAENG
jgi:hypothetical protein